MPGDVYSFRASRVAGSPWIGGFGARERSRRRKGWDSLFMPRRSETLMRVLRVLCLWISFAASASFALAETPCALEGEPQSPNEFKRLARELTESAILHDNLGETQAAVICAERLVDLAEKLGATYWEEKFDALMVLIEVGNFKSDFDYAAKIYARAAKYVPDTVDHSDTRLAIAATWIADLLFAYCDPRAHQAYTGLIWLSECNSLIKSSISYYKEQKRKSENWIDSDNASTGKIKECPHLDYFSRLLL